MAPKAKQQREPGQASSTTTTTTARETRSAIRSSVRATRSATRLGAAALNHPVADPEPRKTKKAKPTPTASPAAAHSSPAAGAPPSAAGKTVIIEHCLQYDSFKKKAAQIKKGLEKAISGVNVVVNPEPPRKGCFEIRQEGVDVFESMLDMKSPFEPLKALDVKKVVSGVVERIK